MKEIDLADLLGLSPLDHPIGSGLGDLIDEPATLISDDDSSDLLPENLQKPTKEDADAALKYLKDSLPIVKPKPIPEIRETYKKFDPLNASDSFGVPNFSNPRELVERINEFFMETESTNIPTNPTLPALAMHLNMTKQAMDKLRDKPIYGPIIDAARTRIESRLEDMLLDPYRKSAAGVALSLKNNFEWAEKQEVKGELTFSVTRKMFSDGKPVEDENDLTTIDGEIL